MSVHFQTKNGNICKSLFPIDFPLEVFNQFNLQEAVWGTGLTLQGHQVNATSEQEVTYRSLFDSMNQGFAGTFDQLDAYLETQMR